VVRLAHDRVAHLHAQDGRQRQRRQLILPDGANDDRTGLAQLHGHHVRALLEQHGNPMQCTAHPLQVALAVHVQRVFQRMRMNLDAGLAG